MEATIVARREVANDPEGLCPVYEYVVEVHPETGAAFRAEAHEPMIATDFQHPREGDVVGVELDPKTNKVRFDKSDPRLSRKVQEQAEKAAELARFKDELAN
ncbi:MAG TPA: hypothetical protein VGG74_12815 [Kofleriaceae bacterium]